MPKAQPPPVPDGLTPEGQAAYLTKHGQAFNLQDKAAGLYLMGSASPPLAREMPAEAFTTHVGRILSEAGDPADPIERMLIEQLVLAHHTIGRLHVEAANAKSVEHAKVATTAVARLLGEFRRCVLSLKRYREPTPSTVTVVQQQNLAAGDQQVAYVAQPPGVGPRNDTNNQQSTSEVAYATSPLIETQSPASGGRKAEPDEAGAFDARGQGANTTSSAAAPSVGEVDRPENARGQGPERAQRQETTKRRAVRPRAAASSTDSPGPAGANGGVPTDSGIGAPVPDVSTPLTEVLRLLAAIRRKLLESGETISLETPSGAQAAPPPPLSRKRGRPDCFKQRLAQTVGSK